MPEETLVLEVENPRLTVKLYENLLRIDLKGSLKNEIEEALENRPVLKETIGGLLGIFAPLHIRLSDIDSARMDETGKIKVTLPHRRDVVITLEPKDAEKLLDKLNQLIPKAKNRELKERVIKKIRKRKAKKKPRGTPPSSYVTTPYYFPTEQVDIVDKFGRRKRKKKRKK
jgi:hypothetical protein